MGSVEVCELVAGFLELEYKDWLCCWWGCVGTGYDSAAASGEAVGSLWREEECDVPWGSDKLHYQKQEQQGSFVGQEVVQGPCQWCWEQKPGLLLSGLLTEPGVGMATARWMKTGHCWLLGWRSS